MNAAENPNRRRASLSRAAELDLARRIESGDLHAKELMIEGNLRLVHAVAWRYRGASVPYADLVQEGTVGLIRAVELFDHRRGVKFSTYAMWWIRRSLHDAIAGAKVIRIPPKANRQIAAVRRAEARLDRSTPSRASDADVAELTALSTGIVRSLRTAPRVVASLDEPVGDGTTPLGELIADARGVDPSDSLIAKERRDYVSAMLLFLPKRHRDVLVRRYGLSGNAVESHKEIGRSIGVGEERTRQLEQEALHRLRSISATLARAA
jgi:RNA polymerase primary sigma factor